MKILLSLMIFFSHFSNPVWITDFEKAKTDAHASNKLILINFSGSDWCIPCIRLHKELFQTETFTRYAANNLVLVNADFPRLKKHQLSKEQTSKNEELADRYNPKGYFPLTLILDANGSVLKQWEGYPGEDAISFVQEIQSLRKTSIP